MPANYGGRISSVLDIQMKEGDYEHFGLEGGIGLISSRLTAEGPIIPKKASFIVSGRRTYLFDLAQPFLKGSDFEGTNYYFYDLNLKANYHLSKLDRLFLSAYFGRDVLDLNNPARGFHFKMPWGNTTATLRWNHLFDNKLFMSSILVFNDYDFSVSGGQSQFQFSLESGIRDYGAKINFDYYPHPQHQFKFGGDYTYHIFTPNVAEAFSGEEAFLIDPDKRYGQEMGLYILDDWKINSAISLNFGIRASFFQQLGPYTSKIDTSLSFSKNQIVLHYQGLEPRLSSKISTGQHSSVKIGCSLGKQYVHLVSNSTTTLPTDLWVPSSELVKPQWGMQYAVGYFHNFLKNSLETSVEIYYKDLYQQLDYSETFTQTIDTDLEDEFISGRGRAYGLEFFIRKAKGKLTGWIAYTLSRSERIFEEIKGNVYPSAFDRTHDLSVVANYDLSPRFNLGASFILGSGSPYTPIQSVYLLNFNPVTQYGLRNHARLPIYHRMDISASYVLSKKSKAFESTLVFSVYNLYNRRNVFSPILSPEIKEETQEVELRSYKVSLFSHHSIHHLEF